MVRTCLECGKEFDKVKRQIYCSRKCSNLHRQREYRGKHKKPDIIRKCQYCGKEFVATRKDKIYCNPKCTSRVTKARFLNKLSLHSVCSA